MSTPLTIFSLDTRTPSLRVIWQEVKENEMPLQIGIAIAGEATEEELNFADWDSAFLRWTEPELHDIALIAVYEPDEPEGEEAIRVAVEFLVTMPPTSSRTVLETHLKNVQRVYAFQTLPALLDEEDHEGWDGVDLALRTLADATGGVIYAEEEGFYSAEGTPFYTPELPEGFAESDESDELDRDFE